MNQDNSSELANDLLDEDDNSYDTIKFYEGVAESLMNDSDTLKVVKIRAKNIAEQNAQPKIADYVNEFLKDRYLTFPDDEILSITNQIFEISNINYGMKDSGGNEMIIQATVTAKVDDNDIMNCLVGFFNERIELKSENEALRREFETIRNKNESLCAENDNLKCQYENLRREIETLHAENGNLRQQMENLRKKIETATNIRNLRKLISK